MSQKRETSNCGFPVCWLKGDVTEQFLAFGGQMVHKDLHEGGAQWSSLGHAIIVITL